MELSWKSNWAQARQHFIDWWDHKGLVLGSWGGVLGKTPLDVVKKPVVPQGDDFFTDPDFRQAFCHWSLAQCSFPADILPIAGNDWGPGSLACTLGSTPHFAPETVWFSQTMADIEDPESLPPICFNENNFWLKRGEEVLSACVRRSQGRYLVGCPDLIENLDTLASLRGTQNLLLDMAIRPDWVRQKLEEINQVWFKVYERIYDIIKLKDKSSAFAAFAVWGPGKSAKVQCDASAMISPAMFDAIVLPALSAQCKWLDHAMYHLDGSQCLCHLDSLLGIESLDAIEWTPDPQVPGGGDPRWYPLYRRILAAGKSVQVILSDSKKIIPLLDAIGGKGVYILVGFKSQDEAEELYKKCERYRT